VAEAETLLSMMSAIAASKEYPIARMDSSRSDAAGGRQISAESALAAKCDSRFSIAESYPEALQEGCFSPAISAIVTKWAIRSQF
jgi:hypothetical protein